MLLHVRAPPSTSAAAQWLPSRLTLRNRQEPHRCFSATFPTASRNSPAILLSRKRLLCHPPGTHDCRWQPKRDAWRDVPHTSRLCARRGTVKWPRPSAASRCDLSCRSRGCSLCSDPNAHRPSQTRREGADKAPPASAQAARAPAPGSCGGTSGQHAGAARHGSAEHSRAAGRFGSYVPAYALPRLAASLLCHCTVTVNAVLLRNTCKITHYVHAHPLPPDRQQYSNLEWRFLSPQPDAGLGTVRGVWRQQRDLVNWKR